jgi:K+-sensing histidine kinase KdpD
MSSTNDQDVAGMLRRWARDAMSGYGDQKLSGERYSDSAKTAEWMVKIESSSGGGILTTSNNSTFPEYCRSMTNPDFSITRRTNANVVDSNKYDSSRVRISNLVFAVPHDVWTPLLELITIQGMLVDSIEFVRLTNQGQVDEIAERVNFQNALIQQIKQVEDIVILEVRIESVEREVIQRDQMNNQGGQNSYTYSVKDSVVTPGGGGGGGDAGGGEDAGGGGEGGGEEV